MLVPEHGDRTAQWIAEDIGGWLSSGQGAQDYSYGAIYGGWKGARIEKVVSLLSPAEKKEVWVALNTPEPMEIGDGDGDGSFPVYEIEFLAELLGVQIKVTKATWNEEKEEQ